jgi:murein DD-endopeptidase MepM/ murein hydrolase activator NlpD
MIRALYLLLTIPVLAISISPTANAQTTTPELIRQGIYFYSPEDLTGNPCATTATNLIGNDNTEKVWNYLTAKGLKPHQVAGVMGNLQAESGMCADRLQNQACGSAVGVAPSDGLGYGLAQWTFTDRQAPLVELAKKTNRDTWDLSLQLDYLWQEFSGKYKSVYDKLVNTSTLEEASDLILVEFEAPLVKNYEERRALGRDILATFSDSATANPTPTLSDQSGELCETNGLVVGGLALPVDKSWYEQEPTWFTKPHWNETQAADIPVPSGTPVYSMTAGTIITAPIKTDNTSYGNGVWIDVGNGVEIIYAHGIDGGEVPGAKQGDTVKPGQLIMHSGNTGNSDGPHLHLEIRVGGAEVCPQPLLEELGSGQPVTWTLNKLPRDGCTTKGVY